MITLAWIIAAIALLVGVIVLALMIHDIWTHRR